MWARFFIAILLIYFGIKVYFWARGFLRDRSKPASVDQSTGAGAINDMVRDPVCGLYVPSDEAVTLMRNGLAVHFCSEDCRAKYLQGRG